MSSTYKALGKAIVYANVREGEGHIKQGQLREGALVEINQIKSGWGQIEVPVNHKGNWVSTGQLAAIEDEPNPPEPPPVAENKVVRGVLEFKDGTTLEMVPK